MNYLFDRGLLKEHDMFGRGLLKEYFCIFWGQNICNDKAIKANVHFPRFKSM